MELFNIDMNPLYRNLIQLSVAFVLPIFYSLGTRKRVKMHRYKSCSINLHGIVWIHDR